MHAEVNIHLCATRSGRQLSIAWVASRVKMNHSCLQLQQPTCNPIPCLHLYMLSGTSKNTLSLSLLLSVPIPPKILDLQSDLEWGGSLSRRGGGTPGTQSRTLQLPPWDNSIIHYRQPQVPWVLKNFTVYLGEGKKKKVTFKRAIHYNNKVTPEKHNFSFMAHEHHF